MLHSKAVSMSVDAIKTHYPVKCDPCHSGLHVHEEKELVLTCVFHLDPSQGNVIFLNTGVVSVIVLTGC